MLTFSEEETDSQEFLRREALREVGVQDCFRADLINFSLKTARINKSSNNKAIW